MEKAPWITFVTNDEGFVRKEHPTRASAQRVFNQIKEFTIQYNRRHIKKIELFQGNELIEIWQWS